MTERGGLLGLHEPILRGEVQPQKSYFFDWSAHIDFANQTYGKSMENVNVDVLPEHASDKDLDELSGLVEQLAKEADSDKLG